MNNSFLKSGSYSYSGLNPKSAKFNFCQKNHFYVYIEKNITIKLGPCLVRGGAFAANYPSAHIHAIRATLSKNNSSSHFKTVWPALRSINLAGKMHLAPNTLLRRTQEFWLASLPFRFGAAPRVSHLERGAEERRGRKCSVGGGLLINKEPFGRIFEWRHLHLIGCFRPKYLNLSFAGPRYAHLAVGRSKQGPSKLREHPRHSKNQPSDVSQKQTELNRRYFIVGERRLSNYWWASVILLGGFGFIVTGISSYLNYNIFDFTNAFKIEDQQRIIAFFPQGLLMCFYGSLGLLLSLYWWLLIYWDVGGGFNEFNKKEGFMRIFRWGYPGKNRRIDLVYPLKDIEAIRVDFKQAQGLLASEQTIYVRLLSTPSNSVLPNKAATLTSSSSLPLLNKGFKASEKSEIPLGGIGQPLTLKEIEKQASELANFLQVGLEGL